MVLSFTDLQKIGSQRIILTGTRGGGKTTTCSSWIEQAVHERWSVSGLLCPAVFENGLKTGINVKDLSTGETQNLAVLVDGTFAEVATDHWKFDPQVLQWGSQVLSRVQQCDLLVVDELGPLEFYRHQGWVEAFELIARGEYRLAVIVIRPELLEEARALWTDANVYSLDKL
jgi:nucleoside-triphosphatase